MDYTRDVEPVTALKSKSAQLIRKARRTRQPVIITQNGRSTAVLQDIETYQKNRDALLLLMAIAQGDRDYRTKRVMADADADRRFKKVLARLTRG